MNQEDARVDTEHRMSLVVAERMKAFQETQGVDSIYGQSRTSDPDDKTMKTVEGGAQKFNSLGEALHE